MLVRATHVCVVLVLRKGENNQDRRIQSPRGNLLTISKFWNSAVLAPVRYPTESLRPLPTNPTRNTMTRNTLPLTQFPHSAQHLPYQRILVRLPAVESSQNPARPRHILPAQRQSTVQVRPRRIMRRRRKRRDSSISDVFFLWSFVLSLFTSIV